MAKDDDKLIRIFEALTSYRPVIGPAPAATQLTLTRPPSWAIGLGVERPAPTLTGPPPPWPIGITITPDMQRDCDWLIQHPDLRDTDEYRTVHDRLAEQLGLSPDTLEPLRSSSRAPRIEDNPSSSSAPPAASPPTEQAAESVPLAESGVSDTASKPKSKPPVDSPPSVKKRVTCGSWVPDVVKAHPRPEGCENYAEYLLPFRPQNKSWDVRTISNELARQGLTHYRGDPAHKTTHKGAHTTHKSAHEKPAKS